jgi:phosphoenolpyruvate phosphomutase
MIALILSAGIGSRLKPHTNIKHKCLVEVADNKSIIDIQLTNLRKNDINDIVIAVGHFKEKIKNHIELYYPDLNIILVNNNKYAFTNCIYSMWLCRKYLHEDMIFLTGDLVFESKVIKDMIDSNLNNMIYVNPEAALNKEDFNVEIGDNGYIKEIGVNVCGKNAKSCYPLYKISISSMKIWMKEIDNYIKQDKTNLYCEDAFNNISDKINLVPLYTTDFCMEIDNCDDLLEAKKYYKNFC